MADEELPFKIVRTNGSDEGARAFGQLAVGPRGIRDSEADVSERSARISEGRAGVG
jgi:hypothetical protein